MCPHPHHGWHFWSHSHCYLARGCLLLRILTGLHSSRISSSFCARWPEGHIFPAHTLVLSLPCSETCYDSQCPRVKSSSLVWPSGLCQPPQQHLLQWWPLGLCTCGTCSLLGFVFFLVCFSGFCLCSSIHQGSLFLRNNKHWSPSLGAHVILHVRYFSALQQSLWNTEQ